MIGEALCVQKGEVRLGKGGVPGNCGNGWGDDFASSAWELLGVKGFDRQSKLLH